MQVYPGYTVKKIEDELSWRVVREMMKCWDTDKTNFYTYKKLEDILKAAHKITYVKKNGKKMTDNQLLNKLSQMGLL